MEGCARLAVKRNRSPRALQFALFQRRDHRLSVGRAGPFDGIGQHPEGIKPLEYDPAGLPSGPFGVAFPHPFPQCGQLHTWMEESHSEQVLSPFSHVIPEIGELGEGIDIEQPGLRTGCHPQLVELVDQDIPGRRIEDGDHHRWSILAQRQESRCKVFGLAIEHIVAVVDRRRLLFQEGLDVFGQPDPKIGVFGKGDHLIEAQSFDKVRTGHGQTRVEDRGVEDLGVPLLSDRIGPAVDIDKGDVVAVGDFDHGHADRAMVSTGDGHDLLFGNELFYRCSTSFRNPQRILKDEFHLSTQDTTPLVQHLCGEFESGFGFIPLADRTGGREGERNADQNRLGCPGLISRGKREEQQRDQQNHTPYSRLHGFLLLLDSWVKRIRWITLQLIYHLSLGLSKGGWNKRGVEVVSVSS